MGLCRWHILAYIDKSCCCCCCSPSICYICTGPDKADRYQSSTTGNLHAVAASRYAATQVYLHAHHRLCQRIPAVKCSSRGVPWWGVLQLEPWSVRRAGQCPPVGAGRSHMHTPCELPCPSRRFLSRTCRMTSGCRHTCSDRWTSMRQ